MARLLSILNAILLSLVALSFTGPAAFAQTPTVTTGAASGVGDLTAVVGGTVHPHGATVFTYVEVGTTTSYGLLFSATPNYFSSNTDTALTSGLGGLQPETTYHYRFWCQNSATSAIGYGGDGTFTTGPASTPPGVGVLSAQPKTTSALVSSFQVTGGSSATTVTFEYGLTGAYGSTVTPLYGGSIPMNGLNSPTASVTGLTPSTVYHYRCKAVNAQGTTYSPDATFTTLDGPVITTGAATGVTDLAALLNGTVNANGGIYNVGFDYGPTTGYGSSVSQGVAYGSTTQAFAISAANLLPATTYHCRMTATEGDVTYAGGDVTFTTAAAGTPPVVTGAVYASLSSNAPTVAQMYPSSIHSGSSPATVTIEYGLTAAYGQQTVHPTPIPTNTLVTNGPVVQLTGLAPSTTYHSRCKATNAQGTVYSDDATFTTKAGPVLVTGLATGVTDLAATLNGTVQTDGLTLTVTFEYGTTTGYGQSALVGYAMQNTSAAAVSAQPPGLLPATTYHYRLKGVNVFDGSFVFFGGDQTFTTAPASTPPTAGAITVANVVPTSVTLNAQFFSGSSPASITYQYGTGIDFGSSAAYEDILPANVNWGIGFLLTGLTPGTTYHVRAVASNAEGLRIGPETTFTTLVAPVVITGAASSVQDLGAVLNGSVNPNNFGVTVSFEIGTTAAYGTAVNATPGTATGSSVVNVTGIAGGLLPATTYHYRAKAESTSAQGTFFYGVDATFTTAVASTPPVVGTAATLLVRTTAAYVQAASASAGSSTTSIAWEYGITTAYGSTLAGNPDSLATGASGAVTGLLTGLLPATTYHYRCRATNGEGAAYSPDATFTTSAGPVISTAAADGATDLTALLHGTASANAGPVTVFFEIGLTTDYGTTVTVLPRTVDTGTSTVTALAAGLLPNTTYHFRLSVTDADSNVFHGGDMALTTGAPATPPVAVTGAATALAATAATLNANLQSGSSAATVVFEYGTTTAYGVQLAHSAPLQPSISISVSDALTGLLPATTYHYRVIATNNEGASTGGDATFTTPAVPSVTTVAATNILPTTASLNGTYHKQGGTYTVAFDYGTTTAYGLTAVPSTGGIIIIGGGGLIIGGGNMQQNATAIAAVQAQTAYHFRLKLTDNYGNSYFGSDATFTTPLPIEAWRQQYFGDIANSGNGADTANPSGDGISNLMKYALWMDPNRTGVLPSAELRDYGGTQYLSIIFSRNPRASDLTYEVQAAGSLDGPWTVVATIAPGAAPTGSGFVGELVLTLFGGFGGNPVIVADNVEVRDIVRVADAPSRFMRVSVGH